MYALKCDMFLTFKPRSLSNLGVLLLCLAKGLPLLPEIEDIWAGSNEIASFDALASLKGCWQLETLYLEHNPLQNNHLYTVNALALVCVLMCVSVCACACARVCVCVCVCVRACE